MTKTDPDAATFPFREILETPLGYPPLPEAVFAGDRILLVPDADYAVRTEILAGIVETFLAAGSTPGDLSLLLTETEEKTIAGKLQDRLAGGASLIFHRPSRRESLAVLGLTREGEPILLPRELVDADMVVSIGRFYRKSPKDHFGIHNAVYPRFSDPVTRLRFAEGAGAARRRHLEEVEEVARQLGIFFTIQFLHGKNGPPRIASGVPDLVFEALNADG